jgi:hypothetical protein
LRCSPEFCQGKPSGKCDFCQDFPRRGDGFSKALKSAEEDDATSEKTLQLSAACSLYVNIVKVQGETQAIRNHIDENWAKRAATARDIESIQHQIHTGKVSDLKDHEAKLQAEMLQNQEKFAAEAAANEAALKAAGEREADLQKALAEERAKAEQRQKDAMNKLNELQSKLIQVSKDARGIILSMSDYLVRREPGSYSQGRPQDEPCQGCGYPFCVPAVQRVYRR